VAAAALTGPQFVAGDLIPGAVRQPLSEHYKTTFLVPARFTPQDGVTDTRVHEEDAMLRRVRVGMVLSGVLIAVVCCSASVAAAATNPSASYAPRYSTMPALWVAGNAGDVLVVNGPDSGPDTVPDTATVTSATGSSFPLTSPAGCLGQPLLMIGGGVIMYDCSSGPNDADESYDVAGSSGWHATAAAKTDALCTQDLPSPETCGVAGVGTQWIHVQTQCYHCATVNNLVSVSTGAVSPDPTGGRVIADLNAANPARTRCKDVTVNANGSVQFVGNLALVTTGGLSVHKYAIKRCRTSQTIYANGENQLIGTRYGLIGTNASLIIWPRRSVWPGHPGTLDGIQAHTDRRFTIKLPKAIAQNGVSELAISRAKLYVGDGLGPGPGASVVWTATLPAALR
jgi:hypothetical protein